MVALVGGMFISHHTTPRLGIDLAGGTSITLKAKAEPGQESAINKNNMNTAVSIMNRRVNGLGVTEAEVQTQGSDNIIVNIPKGTNSEQARQQVGQTAKLYFRPVLTAQPTAVAPNPSASPSASTSGKPPLGHPERLRQGHAVRFRERLQLGQGPRSLRRAEGLAHARREQAEQPRAEPVGPHG